MKDNVNIQKNVTREQLSKAKKGDSFVLSGHRTSANSPFHRAKFKFTTNMAWLVLLGTVAPVPVTIVTVTDVPEC